MIIAVYSPKGGVGKTTVTLALAATAKRKTCAVEFDFSPGDFVSILDLERQKNIIEAVEGRLDYAVQRPKGKNYDVVVGGYPDTYENIKPEGLRRFLDELENRYDLVLVDVQPGFVEGCIDIFDKAERILLVVEDDYSVNSRLIGNVDWARVNGFIDTSKISLIVNKTKGRLRYVNLTDLKFPVLYELPYIKNMKPFNDRRMYKHADRIWRKLLPEDYAERRRLFFAGRRRGNESTRSAYKALPERISAEGEEPSAEKEITSDATSVRDNELQEKNAGIQAAHEGNPEENGKPNGGTSKEDGELQTMPEELREEKKELQTADEGLYEQDGELSEGDGGSFKEQEETSELYEEPEEVGERMGLYIDTGYEELDEEIRRRVENIGGAPEDADTAVVSSPAYAERFAAEGRRVVFLAKGAADAAKARALGIADVFVSPFDLNDVAEAICGRKSENRPYIEEKDEEPSKVDEPETEREVREDIRTSEEKELTESNDEHETGTSAEEMEGAGMKAHEAHWKPYEEKKEREAAEGMETDIYGEIRNIIQRYLVEYERKADEYEGTIADLKKQLEAKDAEIRKYREKTEHLNKLLSEFQHLLGD